MDYKKKYEEAMFRMNKWVEGSEIVDPKEVAEFVFPELKESEDERIRKWLIEMVEEVRKANLTNAEHNGNCSKALVWLEKQGKKKPTLPIWKYKKDRTPLLRDSFILNKYGCVGKSPSGALVSDVWVLDFDELTKLPKEEIEKQGEQKPTWSEEDEKILETLINDTEKTFFAIKQEERPDIMSGLSEIYIERLRWLKSLKERVQPQPKLDWSEDDKYCIHQLILFCEKCMMQDSGAIRCANWLKSLKERYAWKPSDEQMNALDAVIDEYDGYPEFDSLVSLKNDLKKLREE